MSDRVLRGGCWASDPREVRAAIRGGARPPVRTVWFGFRVLQDLPGA
jgi:formylglycine-generating enzyme required for sulfatase activity